jgi:hypothetical protein
MIFCTSFSISRYQISDARCLSLFCSFASCAYLALNAYRDNVKCSIMRQSEAMVSIIVLAYNIVHFTGRPQGPFLSFSAFDVPTSGFLLPAAVVSSFSNTSAFFPLLSEPASQAKVTLLIAVPKLSPWIVASSSSIGLG